MRKLIIFFIFLLVGCARKNAGPLAVEEIPAAIRKGFQTAKEDVRGISEGVARQVEHKQFAPASVQLQMLMSNSELNKEQKELVVRSLGAVNSKLQEQLDLEQATVVPQTAPAVAENNPPKAPTEPEDNSSAEAKAALQQYIRTK